MNYAKTAVDGHTMGGILSMEFQFLRSPKDALAKCNEMFQNLEDQWVEDLEEEPWITDEKAKSICHIMYRFLTTEAKKVRFDLRKCVCDCDCDCGDPGTMVDQYLQFKDSNGTKYNLSHFYNSYN